jgi:hypothetical protein
MARFFIAGRAIDLPAIPVDPKSQTSQRDAWLFGQYLTLRLLAPTDGVRVHTNGRALNNRQASNPEGRWVALDDVIQTASELRGNRALPGVFTHVGTVVFPEQCIINLGVCSPLFHGDGGGFQAEYVSGVAFRFSQLTGMIWHHSFGNA